MPLKATINSFLRRLGYEVRRTVSFEPAMEEEFIEIARILKDHHCQTTERLYGLYKAVKHVAENEVPGDIVECGVFLGASPKLAAYVLHNMKKEDRLIYLYDTFEGMSEPTEKDVTIATKTHVKDILKGRGFKAWNEWSNASLEYVQKSVLEAGYPKDKFRFIKGKVEDTIPAEMPEKIALLRLDTDWYESTYHELVHLYPRLVKGGILILDDYGHYEGAKKAVDQYFSENGIKMLLNRLDYTGRIGIKTE